MTVGDLDSDECHWNHFNCLNDNEVRLHLSSISANLDPSTFAESLFERLAYSKFGMSVGSMEGAAPYGCDEFFHSVHATHANPPKGVSAQRLAEAWRIDFKDAKRTLRVTTQLKKTDTNSCLSRNISTSDRMLRYQRIKSTFFTDTFFVAKKAKSLWGNTCMQLFASDRSFVSVYPMKLEVITSKL